jgi:hypothetical protein
MGRLDQRTQLRRSSSIHRTATTCSRGSPRRRRTPFGNVIKYEYESDIGDTPEHDWDQLYLKTIRYADYNEPATDDDPGAAFLVSVKFVYEERPDAFSDHRAGFQIRTRRQLQRHRGPHPR